VAGLTAGASLGVAASVGIGIGAGAVGNTANQLIRNKGFNNFDVKELAVSTVASGVGFGVSSAVSSTATNITTKIASDAAQKTAQDAIVGAASGSSAGFAANVTDQVFDLVTNDEKENFDFGSLAKDTLFGGITGGVVGGAFGFASSKFGDKINDLEKKLNESIKQASNKIKESAKNTFSNVLKDETGSVKIGGNDSTIRSRVLNNIAESKAAREASNFRNPKPINPGERTIEGYYNSMPAKGDPNSIKVFNSKEFQELAEMYGIDCSELAEYMYNNSGGKGEILTYNSSKNAYTQIKVPAKGGKHELYYYHTVYSDRSYIYNPWYTTNPVPKDVYNNLLNVITMDL